MEIGARPPSPILSFKGGARGAARLRAEGHLGRRGDEARGIGPSDAEVEEALQRMASADQALRAQGRGRGGRDRRPRGRRFSSAPSQARSSKGGKVRGRHGRRSALGHSSPASRSSSSAPCPATTPHHHGDLPRGLPGRASGRQGGELRHHRLSRSRPPASSSSTTTSPRPTAWTRSTPSRTRCAPRSRKDFRRPVPPQGEEGACSTGSTRSTTSSCRPTLVDPGVPERLAAGHGRHASAPARAFADEEPPRPRTRPRPSTARSPSGVRPRPGVALCLRSRRRPPEQ